MLRLINVFKGSALIAVAVIVFIFLGRIHISLHRNNEILESKTKEQAKTIQIQCKVLDVVKNTKAVDFDSNIKRMQRGEL
jgi:hypothetical protein